MEENSPLEDELGKYEDQWVAISKSEQKVVGKGHDAYEAKQDAVANGYTETRLLRVPKFDTCYVL